MQMNDAMLGAIKFRVGEKPDPVIEEVIKRLKGESFSVRGVIQRIGSDPVGGSSRTQLENIADGQLVRISQNLGRQSSGCNLNPAALANASVSLEEEFNKPMDIFVLNRFGHSESEGTGFRYLIELAHNRNIPVLLAVKDIYLDAWTEFAGPLAQPLPLDVDEVVDWCLGKLSATKHELSMA